MAPLLSPVFGQVLWVASLLPSVLQVLSVAVFHDILVAIAVGSPLVKLLHLPSTRVVQALLEFHAVLAFLSSLMITPPVMHVPSVCVTTLQALLVAEVLASTWVLAFLVLSV